jgi:hypothetical protein
MPDSARELAVAAAFAGPHGDQVLPGRELHVGQVQGGGLAEAQAGKGPDQPAGPPGLPPGPAPRTGVLVTGRTWQVPHDHPRRWPGRQHAAPARRPDSAMGQ